MKTRSGYTKEPHCLDDHRLVANAGLLLDPSAHHSRRGATDYLAPVICLKQQLLVIVSVERQSISEDTVKPHSDRMSR